MSRRIEGLPPLPARREPWMDALRRDPAGLARLVERYGSPVNLLHPGPMERNHAELRRAAADAGVELRVFFARKANKALAFVDRALELGMGVDTASERELRQVLDRGAAPGDVVLTAAVKPRALVELCVDSGVVLAVDNTDELALVRRVAAERGRDARVAPRLAPVIDGRPPTRFGIPAHGVPAALRGGGVRVEGVHFHLDGYSGPERVAALRQAMEVCDALAADGHAVRFIDMGGGVPMRYVDDDAAWPRFLDAHARGLGGDGPAVTFRGHPLGRTRGEGGGWGPPAVYPVAQEPVRGAWLAGILGATAGGGTVAGGLRERGLELRLEPGRALLDGCGMTVARVEFRKRMADGTPLVGLAMNRTQVRSAADDFPVDPVLVAAGDPAEGDADGFGADVEGFLVGAYCIERELLTWRRLAFRGGVAVGDLVVFPNTAGYMMHILESASHQIPLAANVVVDGEPRRDDIDASG